MIAFILLWVVVAAIYLYHRQSSSAFKQSGVKHFPNIPLVGNMGRILLQKDHFVEDQARMYSTFPDQKFVGKFEFSNKVIFIRDLELVKRIAVKDVDHFLDHRNVLDDPLFGRNLLALKGQEWKDMRSTLSPAFTSSKIRLMVPFMVEVGDQMMRTLKQDIEASGVGYIDADMKDLTTRYANDVVASCAFGLKVDSHKDVDNEFYAMGKYASNFSFKQAMIFLAIMTFPRLTKWLNLSLFSEESKRFFRGLVNSTMQSREEQNIIRPDMIHLLMEAKKGKLSHEEKVKDTDAGFATVEESSVGKTVNTKREWTQDDLVAQAIVFFLAGFETVSSAMCFLLHELALNPDVQERLLREIRENDARNSGKFDYNSVQSMVYLDMVVSEVLRLWPPGLALDRLCVKDYNLGRPNSESKQDYIVREGEGVAVPVWSIHRDPDYFPDPFRFDPDRFSAENKHSIDPFTYMPFGVGPRNCIGSRFALCEMKVMAYQLLQHMEVSPCPKTCIPSKLSKTTLQMMLEGGNWLRITPRDSLQGTRL